MKSFSSVYIFFGVFILILAPCTIKSQETSADIDPIKRQAWIDKTALYLKTVDPDTVVEIIELRTRQADGLIYHKYKVSNEGIIKWENGDWAYIVLHSQHRDEAIGDLALAIDNKGKFYLHYGHVCGGTMGYVLRSKKLRKKRKHFFKMFFDNVDDLFWQKLKV